MMVEMGMMQQLSIFLGHPIYSLIVVLAGLILFSGIGSLASDRLRLEPGNIVRVPALLAATAVVIFSAVVIPVIHRFVAGVLWERVLICLVLVAPCGFFMGFCFPVGLRWMGRLNQQDNLPWMWALNGAASTLGSFVSILVSMSTSIRTCIIAGACLYVVAGLVIPSTAAKELSPSMGERLSEEAA
jgi:hypothetical protein